MHIETESDNHKTIAFSSHSSKCIGKKTNKQTTIKQLSSVTLWIIVPCLQFFKKKQIFIISFVHSTEKIIANLFYCCNCQDNGCLTLNQIRTSFGMHLTLFHLIKLHRIYSIKSNKYVSGLFLISCWCLLSVIDMRFGQCATVQFQLYGLSQTQCKQILISSFSCFTLFFILLLLLQYSPRLHLHS